MRSLLVAFALVLVTLSGCAGKVDPSHGKGGEGPGPVEPDSGKGSIIGFVLDDESNPLLGVNVFAREAAQETQSAADGAYQFRNLLPGRYALFYQRVGFDLLTLNVDVAADAVAQVDAIMTPFTITTPHYATQISEAFLQCGLPSVNGCLAVPGNDHEVLFNATRDVLESRLECAWESSGVASAPELTISHYYGGEFEDNTRGTSPLVYDRKDLKEAKKGTKVEGYIFVAASTTNIPPLTLQQHVTCYYTEFFGMEIPKDFSALSPT